MGRLDGKVAIITGGASGMGAATVERFVAEGAKVVIADILVDKAKAMAGALEPNCGFVHCDVRSEADVSGAVDFAVSRWGRLDCMFNNAGKGGDMHGISETSLEQWEEFHAVLLRGVFLGMKHAARVMKKQGSGSIISTSSVAGLRACYGPHPYSSAKAAVVHLTRAVAMELATHSIRVNCIAPGGIATAIFGVSAGLTQEQSERLLPSLIPGMAQSQPIPRAGMPRDIASAALWFASDESSFVTGHVMPVDGGLIVGRSWEAVVEQWNAFRTQLGVDAQPH